VLVDGLLADNADIMTDNVADNCKLFDKTSDNGSLSDNVSDNGSLSDKTSDNAYRKVILAYIAGHGEISAVATAKIIERSAETARRVLAQLVREGVLAATGANRNRKYRAAK
jgi:predicted HTH transcriptional regulator